MVQLQVEAEKLKLSCSILPHGLAPEGIKLSNLWIQLAHETKGLIAQDYLQGKVDDAGLLQLEIHRLGINELGRYRLIVKYSYESPERSTEGRTKYECILPAFEVLREERRQRLGSSELVAQGSSIQPIGLPNAPLNHGELAKESDLRALEKYVRFSRESELGPGQGNPKHPAELASEMSESLGRDIEMVENRLEEKIQEANRSIQTLKEEIEALKKENEKLKEQANDTADSLWRFAVDLTIEPAKDGQPLLTESSLVRFGISRD